MSEIKRASIPIKLLERVPERCNLVVVGAGDHIMEVVDVDDDGQVLCERYNGKTEVVPSACLYSLVPFVFPNISTLMLNDHKHEDLEIEIIVRVREAQNGRDQAAEEEC